VVPYCICYYCVYMCLQPGTRFAPAAIFKLSASHIQKDRASYLQFERKWILEGEVDAKSEAAATARSRAEGSASQNGGLMIKRFLPRAVVLLDEFSRADTDMKANVLLSLLHSGRITDKEGREYNCSNCLFVATSNDKHPTELEHSLGSEFFHPDNSVDKEAWARAAEDPLPNDRDRKDENKDVTMQPSAISSRISTRFCFSAPSLDVRPHAQLLVLILVLFFSQDADSCIAQSLRYWNSAYMSSHHVLFSFDLQGPFCTGSGSGPAMLVL
jgi:hypothetical protein